MVSLWRRAKGPSARTSESEEGSPHLTFQSSTSGPSPRVEVEEAHLAYLRRAYESTRQWYSIIETKCQLLLGVNGVFVSVVFGSIFGKSEDVRPTVRLFGPETWIFCGLAVASIVSAVVCAALSMYSLHGRASRDELADLEVDPAKPATYKPEALWYFGHLANLDYKTAVRLLREVGGISEIDVLSHHLITLSSRVLRKHNYANAGWILTAGSLIMIALAAASVILRLR